MYAIIQADGQEPNSERQYVKSGQKTMIKPVTTKWCYALATVAIFGGGLFSSRGMWNAKSTQVLAGSVEREETDGPYDAIKWRRLAEVDENGMIPANALANAVHQREVNANYWADRNTSSFDFGLAWTERGPNNISGRTRAIVIHPTQTNRMWAASVGGGIWYSSDSGATWAPVNDQLPCLAIGCMVIDPVDPNIMYAGTGEGYFNGDALSGVGMYKSTDGGVTWSVLASTSSFSAINRIAISPSDHNILLMGTTYGGIYKSTDAGSTWTNTKSAQVGVSIAFDPTNGSKVVASVLDYSGGWFYQTLYSTDGGSTWTQATGTIGHVSGFTARVELAYAPSNTSIVYGTCGADAVIYKSTDGGHTFAAATTGTKPDLTAQGWYDNCIWVDPTNANFVVVGGTYMWKSTNAAVSFSKISNGYIMTTQPHPDEHFITSKPGFDGSTNKTLYMTSDGGPFKTDDIYTASTSAGWAPLGNQRTGQYYGAAGNGTNGRIVGGLQDNGVTITMPGSMTSSLYAGGDGGWCAIDPTDANYLYGEYVYLQIHRSTDGGTNGAYIYSGISDAGSNANFIAPFILDPNNVNRMLAGGKSLWRSNNVKAGTPTWASIKASNGTNISAIAVAPGNSDIIYVGHNDGRVYKTTNGTAASPTWTAIDDNSAANPFPNRYVTRILVSNADSNKVYVALGGFSDSNFWMTANGGTSWSDMSGTGATGLPFAPIRGIAQHATLPNTMYVGTQVGIFATYDGGANWSTNNLGPSNVSVDELNFLTGSNTLLAATHGRGLWTADLLSVTGLTLTPSTQYGGLNISATINLSGAATAGGMKVNLSSTNAAATPPAIVTVPEGASSITFDIPTSIVLANATGSITATLGNTSATQACTVKPVALSSISLSGGVYGGKTEVVTVNLTSPAPAGGIVVALSDDSTAATTPASVTIPAGATSATKNITTVPVVTTVTVKVTATYNAVSRNATFAVKQTVLNALQLDVTTVTGGSGTMVTGKAALASKAAVDTVITLTSSNTAAATCPSTVTVLAGQTFVNFPVTHKVVPANTFTIFSATYNGVTKTRKLTVLH